LIIIPNDRLLEVAEPKTTVVEAFELADEVLTSGVAGITDLITTPGLINVDFADVKTVMADAGSAVMGIGRSTGEQRAIQAADKAIASPLLETSMAGSRGVLLSIAGPSDLTLLEVNQAAGAIADHCDADANVIFGAVIDDSLGDEVKVTVIAAGFDSSYGGSYTAPRYTAAPPAFEDDGGLDIPDFVEG
jgi:cell division protein FtsZ